MLAISFAWTAPALLAGEKTVTRRFWTDRYARMFRAGEKAFALDRTRRNGGREIAIIEIARDPYLQSTAEMTADDWRDEGFAYLNAHPEHRPRRVFGRPAEADEFALDGGFERWRAKGEMMYVVRFRFLMRLDAENGQAR